MGEHAGTLQRSRPFPVSQFWVMQSPLAPQGCPTAQLGEHVEAVQVHAAPVPVVQVQTFVSVRSVAFVT